MTEKEKAFERYLEILIDPQYISWTQEAKAKELGVAAVTLWRWDKEVDWDKIKEQRRAKFAQHTTKIDDALVQKAKKGDLRAIEVYYQRFDGWVPRSEVKEVHDIDESLIDEELKALMASKQDVAAALNQTNQDNDAERAANS